MILAPRLRPFTFVDVLVLVGAVAAVLYAGREIIARLKTETPPRPRTGWRHFRESGDTINPAGFSPNQK